MTDPNETDPKQLQYCPLCHRLVRPSIIHSNEAVYQDGRYIHTACVGKAHSPSGGNPSAGRDFDNEDGARTDFTNYDKVVAQSITTLRSNNASPGQPVTGAQAAVRRKTTAAVTSDLRGTGSSPSARRSSVRSYSVSSNKKSPAVVMGVAIVVLVLLGISAMVMLNSRSLPTTPPSTAHTDSSNPPPTSHPAPTGAAPGPYGKPESAAPLATVPTVATDPQASPYEIARANQSTSPVAPTPTATVAPGNSADTQPSPNENAHGNPSTGEVAPTSTTPEGPGNTAPAAAPGVLVIRLEGVHNEKAGVWSRVRESQADGRTFVTWTGADANAKHPPAFITFQNPKMRPMPTKICFRICYRFNRPVGDVRMLFSTSEGEELIGTGKANAADVGKWIEEEFTFPPNTNPKDEIFFKLGSYPKDFAVDIDWVEIYDLTKPAP